MLTSSICMHGPQKSISNNGPSLHSVVGPMFLDDIVNTVQVCECTSISIKHFILQD
jgi:hypothetical protein